MTFGRKKPGVEVDVVLRLKPKVFERPAKFSTGRNEDAIRMINLVVFKPAQHGNEMGKLIAE